MDKIKSDKLIVLDLDETLFHCDYVRFIDKITDTPDYFFVIKNGSKKESYSAIKRPYVDEFLKYIKENFEYGIFTVAGSEYAEHHMEKLDLDPKFILSYNDCTIKKDMETFKEYGLKKLMKLKKYSSLSKMIAIDDKHKSYEQNYGNLVHVPPFKGDLDDSILLKLMLYLEDLKEFKDVTKIEKRGWLSKY